MAKLNSQNFTVEGFQEQSSWIGKLFSPLNSFISQVYSAFQNKITINDNLYQEIKQIEFVNEASNFPLNFAPKFKQNPQFIFIGRIIDSDGGLPSVAPLIDWEFTNNYISIKSITGLTTSSKYIAKFLIIYE